MWSLTDAPSTMIAADAPIVHELRNRAGEGQPWYSALDVTEILLTRRQLTMHSASPRVWMMLTITDNTTQQVTIITPED